MEREPPAERADARRGAVTSSTQASRAVGKARLHRVISLRWLVLYGLGSTVGAGIYALTGVVAGRAGLLAPLAFLLAALLALSTAASFAEFSSRLPRAGGALVYVRAGLRSSTLSVLVGLMSATAGIVSAATVSVGFVGYLAEIHALPNWAGLILVVGSVGGIAAWGVRQSVLAAGLITIIEVLGLVAILLFGLYHLAQGPIPVTRIASEGLAISPWSGVLGATVLGFYAYLGFEDMVNVAEEVRDARRSLPRAILWTLGLSTLLYIGVSAVAVLTVPPTELAASPAPLSLVFERSGGSPEVLALIALAAMLNGALVQIVMASRILFSLSRDGPLPKWLSHIDRRRRTPTFATLAVSIAVGLFAAFFPLESLAAATASIALLVFSLVNFSLVAVQLRERSGPPALEPSPPSRIHVPILLPALGGSFSLAFLALELASRLGG